MGQRGTRGTQPAATVLVGIVAILVLLVGALAYQTFRSTRVARTTVERALGEYAALTADAFRTRFDDAWRLASAEGLSPFVGGLAVSPFDPLPSLAAMAPRLASVLQCPDGSTNRRYVRFDARSGALEVSPAASRGVSGQAATPTTLGPQPGSGHRALAEGVDALVRRSSPDYPIGIRRLTAPGQASYLVVGVKYARQGGPLGAFGFTVCRQAIESGVMGAVAGAEQFRAMGRHLAIAVKDEQGATVFASGVRDTSGYSGMRELAPLPLTVTVTLAPDALGAISLGSLEGSPAAFLIALVVVAALLAIVALVQLRREAALTRLRHDFTSSVSHELRTPLAQVLLYGETLAYGRAKNPDAVRTAGETIVREASRLVWLVENLLAFGRSRTLQVSPGLVPVDLNRVLQESIRALEPILQQAGAKVVVQGDAPFVLAEPVRLQHVFVNLIDNAVKYGRPNATVRVVVETEPNEHGCRVKPGMTTKAIVSVIDEGPGIDLRDRERVFEPYVRLERNAAAGGTGLGLAVVRDFVTQLGGSVSIVEPSSTAGTCVRVELRLADQTDAMSEGRTVA